MPGPAFLLSPGKRASRSGRRGRILGVSDRRHLVSYPHSVPVSAVIMTPLVKAASLSPTRSVFSNVHIYLQMSRFSRRHVRPGSPRTCKSWLRILLKYFKLPVFSFTVEWLLKSPISEKSALWPRVRCGQIGSNNVGRVTFAAILQCRRDRIPSTFIQYTFTRRWAPVASENEQCLRCEYAEMNLKYLGCLINITSCPVNEKNGTANGDVKLAHAGLRVGLGSRHICCSRILWQVNMAFVVIRTILCKDGRTY